MKENEKKNLLIIYQDSSNLQNTCELESLFDIINIPRIKRINIKDFKLKGNHLVAKYNDILFTTNSDFVFFICSSEINESVIKDLLNFSGLKKDFDFFIGKKTNKLLEFLSGFVVKKETLFRIGCFDRYTFYNLYLNFLINYSRFCSIVTDNEYFLLKLGSIDFMRYSYWYYFEQSFYRSQPLYEKDYKILNKKMDSIINNSFQKKIISTFMKWIMNKFSSKTEKIVQSSTYLEYW